MADKKTEPEEELADAASGTPHEQEPESQAEISSDGDEGSTTGDVRSGGTRRRRRRSRSVDAQKYSNAKKEIRLLRIALVIAVAVVTFVVFAAAIVVSGSREELRRSESASRQIQLDAERLSHTLESQRRELAALLSDRIEGLNRIRFGQVMEVDLTAVRSVRFDQTHLGDETRLEYKLVIENPNERFVVPDFEIVVFDRRGFQIRAIPIRPGEGEHTTETLGLWAGDVRTIQGDAWLTAADRPAHFLLRFAQGSPLAVIPSASPELDPPS